MARQTAISINTIPIGPLGIIGMPGCEELTDKIDKYLVKWRKTQSSFYDTRSASDQDPQSLRQRHV